MLLFIKGGWLGMTCCLEGGQSSPVHILAIKPGIQALHSTFGAFLHIKKIP